MAKVKTKTILKSYTVIQPFTLERYYKKGDKITPENDKTTQLLIKNNFIK